MSHPSKLSSRSLLGLFLASMISSASAVTTFTETFDTNASGWLTGASGAVVHSATGGAGGTGYISYTSTFTSGATGSFPGASPLQILMRGNNAANASGGAFTGSWVTPETVQTLSVDVRHNYSTSLDFYARLDAGGGAAASLAGVPAYSITPNTWTTISIHIVNSNPPFVSFGAGSFASVFNNVQNLQFGLYVPASTTFTDLTFDIDNVRLVAAPVPEPSALGLLAIGGIGALSRRRRR